MDGYGQCNTKGTLFIALLCAVGVPCRIRGFTIDKKLQSAPASILHSWLEVLFDYRHVVFADMELP